MKKKSPAQISLFSSAFSIFQRNVFIYVLTILNGVVVARTLGPEILGVWVLVTLVSSYAEGFGRLKTDLASVYMLGSEKAKPEEILFSITFFAIISSFIIAFVLFWQLELIENILFQNTELSYRKELICIIFLLPFEFLLLNYLYFYIALENVVIYNRIRSLQAILNFGVLVFFILVMDFKLWAIVLAKILSVTIALVYAWQSSDNKNWAKLGSRWNKSLTLKILRYAFNFYLIGIIGHINRLTIKTIAAISFNTSQLAFFSQGESASKLLNAVPDSLGTILYPRISRLETREEAVEVSCKSFRITFLIMTLSGLVLALIAKPLIIFLYGSAFEPTVNVLRLAIPGVIIGSSCLTLVSFFQGRGEANIIPKLQITPVLLQIVFAYLFINWWGLNGAAIAFSLGFSLYGLVVLFAFMWNNKVSVLKIIPQVEDIRLIYTLSIDIIKKKSSATVK